MQVLGGSQPLPNTQVTRVSQWTLEYGKSLGLERGSQVQSCNLICRGPDPGSFEGHGGILPHPKCDLESLRCMFGQPKGVYWNKERLRKHRQIWECIQKMGARNLKRLNLILQVLGTYPLFWDSPIWGNTKFKPKIRWAAGIPNSFSLSTIHMYRWCMATKLLRGFSMK